MRAADPTSDGRLLGGVLLAFAAVAALAGLDLAADLREGAEGRHLAIEGGIVLVACSAASASPAGSCA